MILRPRSPPFRTISHKYSLFSYNARVKRVLVCEDDEAIGGLLHHLVARLPAEAQHARNGIEALERIGSEQFDAIVMDLMMPKMSGYDVLDELRRSRPELLARTVVVSAHPIAMKNPPKDVVGFYAKPFDIDALMLELSVLLRLE